MKGGVVHRGGGRSAVEARGEARQRGDVRLGGPREAGDAAAAMARADPGAGALAALARSASAVRAPTLVANAAKEA